MPEYIVFTYRRYLAGGCGSIVNRFWCVGSFDSLPNFENNHRPGPGWELVGTIKIFDWKYGSRLCDEYYDDLWPVEWSQA